MDGISSEQRGLNAIQAARYLGMGEDSFRAKVRSGALPGPVSIGGVRRWDRCALDALFSPDLSSDEFNEWDE